MSLALATLAPATLVLLGAMLGLPSGIALGGAFCMLQARRLAVRP